MKILFKLQLILILVVTGYTSVQAQSYYNDGLKVLNPNIGNWTKTAGKFENVNVVITPVGNYTNFDIEFEISANATNLSSAQDSLEAEYKFSLPSGSIIHNAVLWMNGVPVKAQIYERNKAKFIYEGLVSRKVDPLILYQNGDNTYEARIYPIINPNNRKFSISYLVPNSITSKGVEVPMDLRMFRSDLANWNPTIHFSVLNNTILGTPSIPGITSTLNGSYTLFDIQGTDENLYLNNAIYFGLPLSNNFFITQPISANEGYYQMMVTSSSSPNTASHTVFVVDYRTANYITYPTLLSMLKNKIKYSLRDIDKFNVVYNTSSGVQRLSTNWIDGTSNSIDSIFATLPSNLSANTSSFLMSILDAINFLNNNGAKGSILILSNADGTGSNSSFQNQIINTTLGAMTNTYKVNVFDFNNIFNYSLFDGSNYFYNNEYYFYNLSVSTGGNYFSLKNGNSSTWYYNALSSFVDKLSKTFKASKKMHSYDFVSSSSNSILHSNYLINNKVLIPEGEAYMEVGKYIGVPTPSLMSYYYGIDSTNYTESFSISPMVNNDTLTKKMWGSNFINDLINSDVGGLFTSTIINNSIQFDVLCEYTALLALEPDTAGTITNDIPTSTSEIYANADIEIKAYPNPFSTNQTIECSLNQSFLSKEWSVEVFNSVGQLVSTKKGKVTLIDKFKIDWYNQTELNLTSGIYFVKIKIGGFSKTYRALKQ